MFIINTRIIVYMKRPEGRLLRILDVLKSTFYEMIADEFDCEMNQRMDLFDKRWGSCEDILRNIFE